MGALEAVSRDGNAAVFAVAGQSFSVSADQASDFVPGDYVVAAVARSGATAVVYQLGSPYVPGISTVRLKGTVQSVDVAKGRLAVGALVVDYTPQLATDPAFLPSVGETIEVVGVQPSFGGILVVNSSGHGVSVATGSTASTDASAARR